MSRPIRRGKKKLDEFRSRAKKMRPDSEVERIYAVETMAQHTEFQRPILTPQERAEQEEMASRIVDEILAEDGQK